MAGQKNTGTGFGQTGLMKPLGDLDNFEIAKNIPDPRGWDVMTSDGSKIGKVHELIVDTKARRTRYIDVSLDRKALNLTNDRDVLIPIGDAQLDSSADEVVIGGLTPKQLADLPEFNPAEITREYESTLLRNFGTRGTVDVSEGSDFYTDRHFDEKKFFAPRTKVGDATIMERGGLAR
ncbi:MAG TPA: PRC-barrel domain-containing protein [Gemmatimonadaceae bacterium]|nr:PRC-barrel domain-containing protein [Gemmatimonadaceae bacterium]